MDAEARPALFFVRPRRHATVRTRLGLAAVRSRLAALAGLGPPEGWARFRAHGYFLDGGSVGPTDFVLDYRFDNPKNAQVYTVRGAFEETEDWRYVHLAFEAHDPWIGGWELSAMIASAAVLVGLGHLPLVAAACALGFPLAIWAWGNLWFVPGRCCHRAASWIASELSGSVQAGDRWVVPK